MVVSQHATSSRDDPAPAGPGAAPAPRRNPPMPIMTMLRTLRRCLVLAAFPFLALPGCAALGPVGCPPAARAQLTAEMLFGRNIGDRLGVSEAAWSRFVDAEVTPRFPAGLTIVDARGQWRDTGHGRIVREPSKLLIVVADDTAESRDRLAAIADAYKRQFRQQAVATVLRPACVSF